MGVNRREVELNPRDHVAGSPKNYRQVQQLPGNGLCRSYLEDSGLHFAVDGFSGGYSPSLSRNRFWGNSTLGVSTKALNRATLSMLNSFVVTRDP